MTKLCPLLVLLCLPFTATWSQKIYTVARLETAPVLDGLPDDSCWQQITPTDNFLTSTPVYGLPARPATVRLFYTADALYLAATFADSLPRTDLSRRDDPGTADWFSIGLDTWDDDQNAFTFTVTAAGIQSESQRGSGETNDAWDAVWQSAVAEQAGSWSLEIRLPFTALRFPKGGDQHWGLQLSYYDRRSGTLSTWSPQQPLIGDEVLQYGALEGLQDIHQRQRRSAALHLGASQGDSKENDGVSFTPGQAAFGVDARLGFGSNSTLDVALIPGTTFSWSENDELPLQDWINTIQSTNAELPGSRQLLAEARPMFDKSRILLDYVALEPRVSKAKLGEYLIGRKESQVWSVAKFSTRLPGNVGIGVYSTLLGPSSVQIGHYYDIGPPPPVETRSLSGVSNYTLVTVEKAFANNSWISLSNASLLGQQRYHNNLSSLSFQLRAPGSPYQVAGNVQANIPEVNDTVYAATTQYQFSLSKVNGAWTWQLVQERNRFISTDILNADPYSPNKNYYSNSSARLNYRDYRLRGWRLNTAGFVRLNKKWQQWAGEFDPLTLDAGLSALNRRFQLWSVSLSSDLQKERRTYFFHNGLQLQRQLSPYVQGGLAFRTDDRRRLYARLNASAGTHLRAESAGLAGGLQLFWAVNTHFQLHTENSFFFDIRATSPLYEVAVPGYYLRQYNLFRSEHKLAMTWFRSPSFNMFAEFTWPTNQYRRQRSLQVSEDNQLLPFAYPLQDLSFYFMQEQRLGMQWFFTPISQLRLDFTHFKNIFTPKNRFNIYPGTRAGSQLHLSFIYWLQ